MIDFTSKLIVFLEPPHHETWNILKTMLSHDTEYVEHPYVYDVKNVGFKVKNIVTKGWPACIFCSAKDESSFVDWPEIRSRFLVNSVIMIQKKYKAGNKLIAAISGLPESVKQKTIVSDKDIELSIKCGSFIKQQIKKHPKIIIPYFNTVSDYLPSDKGTDNRFTKRLFSFLKIITQCNAHSRYKLRIIEPDNDNKVISTDNFRKTYLPQLINDELVDEQPIEKGKYKHGYRAVTEDIEDPLVDYDDNDNEELNAERKLSTTTQNLGKLCDNLQYSEHLLCKNLNKLAKDWLEVYFLLIFSHRLQIEVFDSDNKHVCLQNFIYEYTKRLPQTLRYQDPCFEKKYIRIFGKFKFIGTINDKTDNSSQSIVKVSEVVEEKQTDVQTEVQTQNIKQDSKTATGAPTSDDIKDPNGKQIELPLEVQQLASLEKPKEKSTIAIDNSNDNDSTKLPKVAETLGKYVAFDLEWNKKTHVILAASFVDSVGNQEVYFNEGSEIELLEKNQFKTNKI